MLNVRFVEGTAENFSITYDTEWSVVPRVGEFISITVGTGQVMDWEVTRVAYVAGGDEKLIGRWYGSNLRRYDGLARRTRLWASTFPDQDTREGGTSWGYGATWVPRHFAS